MARTFRNRSTVPPGYVIHDGGRAYRGGVPIDISHMPTYRRSYLECEKAAWRRPHMRASRARWRHLMRLGRFDDLPRDRRTGGWLTW